MIVVYCMWVIFVHVKYRPSFCIVYFVFCQSSVVATIVYVLSRLHTLQFQTKLIWQECNSSPLGQSGPQIPTHSPINQAVLQ